MKKITLLVAALAFIMLNVQAQEELVSKKGFKILPEAGDYAIGVDFAPFVNTLNFMGGASAGPRMSFGDGLSIFGKYYTTADMAYRVKFAVNHVSNTTNNYVTDQNAFNPTAEDVVMDKGTFSYARYSLGVGFEKRRGNGRLQGYYGADFFFEYSNAAAGVNNTNFSAEYGNAYDPNYTTPESTIDFTNGTTAQVGSRTLEVKQGGAMGVGVRAFAGVEYFIAPKISIGGEVGWGVAYQIGFDGSTTTEEWDPVSGSVKTVTTENGGSDNQFVVGTTGATQGFLETNGWLGLGGNINIIFHF